MLKTKSFAVGSDEKINEFLDTVVPTSISHEGAFTIVVYDDNAPINDVQRKNALRAQIAKQEEKILQAKMNVSLTKEAAKNIKDSMNKELKERIRMSAQDAKDTLSDEENIIKKLNELSDSLGV